MKLKHKVILILILVLIIQITIITKIKASTTGVITEITVNVRQEPSTDSKIITRVTQDDEVEVIEKSGDWYKIKTKNKTGYVYAEYLKVDDSKIAEENIKDDEEEITKDVEKSFYVSKGEKLSIVPNISSSIIYTAKKDENVDEIEQINGWSYINVNNYYGWIRTENLKEDNKEESNGSNKKVTNSEEKKETKNITKYVKYDKVNLRKEPSIDSKSLQKLNLNTKVTVVEEVDSKWSKVKIDGEIGYISTELLAIEKQKEEKKESKETTTSRNSEENRKETESNKKNNNKTNTEEKKEDNKAETTVEKKEETKTGTSTKTESQQKTTGEDIVNYAKKYLGSKYVYGGTSPKTGFDCSGFTQYVYKHFGYKISRTSTAQASNGTKVEKKDLKAGDLIIFKNTALTKIGHVGIYIGNNKFIHACNEKYGVIISNLSDWKYPQRYVTARRIIK